MEEFGWSSWHGSAAKATRCLVAALECDRSSCECQEASTNEEARIARENTEVSAAQSVRAGSTPGLEQAIRQRKIGSLSQEIRDGSGLAVAYRTDVKPLYGIACVALG